LANCRNGFVCSFQQQHFPLHRNQKGLVSRRPSMLAIMLLLLLLLLLAAGGCSC
jgi:hypothetical protein